MADLRKLGKGMTGALAQAKSMAKALKVRPPSDNIATVREANFQYPKTIGNQTVKIGNLNGGVRMSDPAERKRVEALAQKMSSPEGYISRLIVDHNNDVIEGQHRLEALRQLGIEDVPVYKIEDLSATMPVDAMRSALGAVGPIHPDHAGQLVGQALENIAEYGVAGAKDFDYGRHQKHYDAAIDAAQGVNADITKAKGGVIHMADAGKVTRGITGALTKAKEMAQAKKAASANQPGVHYADPLKPADMRLSEALGNAGAEGKTLNFTETDRSRVKGQNRGGVGFAGLQHYSRPHKKANTVWGFGNTNTAEKKIRQNDPENSLWTTFIGSPQQHKSNSVVIGDAMKEFQNSVKQGVVPREQIMLMNKRLNELTDPKTGAKVFENGFDLTDPAALNVANTFSRRAAVGDVMLGLGVKGPMARLDFKKEFPNTKFTDGSNIENILKRETDPDLVDAGTYDVGNRLFVMDGKIIQRPDLNEAFPDQVTGYDLGMKYKLVPPEKAMRDFYKAREGRKDKNDKPSPVTYYDLARAEPSQLVDEDYLTFLQKEGYKKGGTVNREESPEDMARFHKRFAMHKALGGRVSSRPAKMANGGATHTPPKKTEGFVEEGPKNKSIFDKMHQAVKEIPKIPTSPFGSALNLGYEGYKYFSGKDPLADLQKELHRKLHPEMDTGSVPVEKFSKGGSSDEPTTREIAEALGELAVSQGKKEYESFKKPRAATDIGNRGILAPALGLPVDMINMGLGGVDALTGMMGKPTRLSSEKPFAGSEHIKDLMNKYGVTSGEDRPMTETALSLFSPTGMIKGAQKTADLAKKAPEALNTVRGGLETMSANAQRPFRPATLTMEAVAPDLGQKGGDKFKDLVTKRMISGEGAPVSMERMGGRKTEKTLGQGLYENFAGQQETNPMVGITIPRAGNLSTNKRLIADIGTAGQELGQEMVAAHKFTPLMFKNPKDATAMMIGGSERLTKEQIQSLADMLPGMIVTHSPKNNSMFVAPFEGDALDYKKAAQAANEILGKGAKVQFGKADSTKDIMFRGDYEKMGARPPSAESTEMRNRLKKAEERIVRGPSVSQSGRQSQPSTLTSTVR